MCSPPEENISNVIDNTSEQEKPGCLISLATEDRLFGLAVRFNH